MSFSIIYGRAGSGKTSRIMEHISSIISTNTDKVIYLVPEQYSFASEQEIATKFSGGSVSRIDALSFARLSNRVFSKFGPLYQEYISASGRCMLLQKATLDIKKQLNVLSSSSEIADFAGSMSEQISELKRNNITPEQLLNTADSLPVSTLGLKLRDLSLIYEKYNTLIAEPYGDTENNLNILCDKIEHHNLFIDTHFFFDAFSDFTPQEMSVIAILLAKSKSVTVALTADSLTPSLHGIDVFSLQKRTAKELMDLARSCGREIVKPIALGFCKKFNDKPELKHLEENFFSYPAKIYSDKTQGISIFEANNPRGEVVETAKTILRLCRENGLKFKEISVSTRNTSIYAKHVQDIFEQYGISVFCDEKESALKHPLVQLPLSLLEIFIYNYNYSAMFKYIKLGFSPLEPEQIYMLENYALAAGITKKQWTSSSPLTFLPKGFTENDLENINISKNLVTKHFSDFLDKIKGQKTTSQIIKALYDLLVILGITEQIDLKLSNCDVKYADKTRQAWNALITTFDQMDEFLGDSKITLEKFHSVLTSGLESFEIAQIPPVLDRVHFGSLERFKEHSPKVLFILGTLDGALPKSFRQTGLLSDSDRKTLAEHDVLLSMNSTARQLAEQSLIYNCLTAAKEHLFLSYPVADSQGETTVISPVIKRIKRIFPQITTADNLYIKPSTADEIEGFIPTFKTAISKLKNSDTDNVWRFVQDWFKKNKSQDFDNAKMSVEYCNIPKKLSPEILEVLYGQTPRMSISRVEQFAKCQFSYFLKYGLATSERHEYKISAPDAGNFMHKIIERYSLHVTDWKSITRDYCLAKTAEITDSVLRENLGEIHLGTARFNRLSVKLKKLMSTTTWNITQFYQQSSFTPMGFELGFGDNQTLPPIIVTLENGREIRLSGKVDRVDICGDYISIVDYKSGTKDIDFSQILCGVQVQLPTYIDAICKGTNKTLPAAMLYYTIDSPVISTSRDTKDETVLQAVQNALRMRGLILDNEEILDGFGSNFIKKNLASANELEKLCKFTVSKVSAELEKVFKGEIMINPYSSGGSTSCDYCPYFSICQFDGGKNGTRYRSLRNFKKEDFFTYVEKLD